MSHSRKGNTSAKLAKFAALGVLHLPLLVVACGSSGESQSDGGKRPSGAELDAFLETYCTSALNCCADMGMGRGDVELCKDNFKNSALARGYDPVAGAACLAELESAEQRGQCWAVAFGPSDSCTLIWSGQYGSSDAGEACSDDSDCAVPNEGISVCREVATAAHCQVLLPGTEGDGPCVGDLDTFGDVTSELEVVWFADDGSVTTGYLCSYLDGLRCDTASFTCEPRLPDGAGCESGRECLSSSFCNIDTCAPYVEPGGSCNATRCDASGYCDYATLLCTQRLAAGSPCGADDECESGVCGDGVCTEITQNDLTVLNLACTAGG